jgi:hypothetical protein
LTKKRRRKDKRGVIPRKRRPRIFSLYFLEFKNKNRKRKKRPYNSLKKGYYTSINN